MIDVIHVVSFIMSEQTYLGDLGPQETQTIVMPKAGLEFLDLESAPFMLSRKQIGKSTDQTGGCTVGSAVLLFSHDAAQDQKQKKYVY